MEAKQANQTIRVNGMTCANCESRIENELNKIKGVTQADARYTQSSVKVTYDSKLVSLNDLEEAIETLGYQVVRTGSKQKFDIPAKPVNAAKIAGVTVIILAAYLIVSRFGGFNFFNSFPQAGQYAGYGTLFLIGLLTSVHCVAMCGGINLSQCVPHAARNTENVRKFDNLRPSLLYNFGRVISYAAIGGGVGAIGSVVSFSGAAKGIVAIVAGIFMVIMGLNMLNIFPWLRRFNPRMPKVFAQKINAQKKSNSPLYVGLLNGLMPCGPLQAMQLFALSTGSPVKGALSMMAFSIGTVPLMFGLGALSSVLSKKFTGKMMTVSAVLVLILGVFMFSNGMSLSGSSFPSISAGTTQNSNSADTAGGVQSVTTKLFPNRYEPITVKAGVPVKWNIQADAKDITGCNQEIIIPKYNIRKKLVPGDNIIEFTPGESGIVPFSCWMGMIKSKITIID